MTIFLSLSQNFDKEIVLSIAYGSEVLIIKKKYNRFSKR